VHRDALPKGHPRAYGRADGVWNAATSQKAVHTDRALGHWDRITGTAGIRWPAICFPWHSRLKDIHELAAQLGMAPAAALWGAARFRR
jgi:hypothetical protein